MPLAWPAFKFVHPSSVIHPSPTAIVFPDLPGHAAIRLGREQTDSEEAKQTERSGLTLDYFGSREGRETTVRSACYRSILDSMMTKMMMMVVMMMMMMMMLVSKSGLDEGTNRAVLWPSKKYDSLVHEHDNVLSSRLMRGALFLFDFVEASS
eukprot:3469540-Rhodomonas_salina.4